MILGKIHVIKIHIELHHSSTISESEQNKTCGNESHEKEVKPIHSSAADLLHVRIGNLYWCK